MWLRWDQSRALTTGLVEEPIRGLLWNYWNWIWGRGASCPLGFKNMQKTPGVAGMTVENMKSQRGPLVYPNSHSVSGRPGRKSSPESFEHESISSMHSPWLGCVLWSHGRPGLCCGPSIIVSGVPFHTKNMSGWTISYVVIPAITLFKKIIFFPSL